MVTLSGFRRRLSSGGQSREVQLSAAEAVWLPAQEHSGDTPTHTILIELEGQAAGERSDAVLDPVRAEAGDPAAGPAPTP